MKCQETAKDVHHSLPESKVTSSNVLFHPTNSPKSKDVQFTIMEG